MNKKSCEQVEKNADDHLGKEANGRVERGQQLDLLEAAILSDPSIHKPKKRTTHNRLRKYSTPLSTAYVRKTRRQMVVNALLRHSEFGIRAMRPDFSRKCIQNPKETADVPAMHSMTMFSAFLALAMFPVMTLCKASAMRTKTERLGRLTQGHRT